MRGFPRLLSFWRVAIALLLLIALLWLATDPHSQTPAGVLGLFAFSLFISLGFILFGQQRFDASPGATKPEDQHFA
ncbi:hypothetical protein [Pseudomonas sp. Ga0074129]|uniref:hypothetical protein n=1 Tax=Pseudomonas sp. Ga0074129 TaxID=1752219 RepID=UPI000A778B0C|nr:hypothetical protein [Pseudomonas sp. Ga0074129]